MRPHLKAGEPPLLYTTIDLSHVSPGLHLGAERPGIVLGMLVALPLSLGLWALLFSLL